MKTAPRFVGAALALAAVVAMPFMQPVQQADAASGPDLAVQFLKFDGPKLTTGHQAARFAIRNIGPVPSSAIVTKRSCAFRKFNEDMHLETYYVDIAPPLVLPALPQGQATTVLFDCPEGSTHAKLTVAAQPGEIDTSNNADTSGHF
jgi:hypothetical protein